MVGVILRDSFGVELVLGGACYYGEWERGGGRQHSLTDTAYSMQEFTSSQRTLAIKYSATSLNSNEGGLVPL